MRPSFLGALAFLVLASGGCGNSGNIVGNWVDDSHDVSVRFNPDGTYEQETHRGQVKVIVSGTYTLSRNHLTCTSKDVRFENIPSKEDQEKYKEELLQKPPDQSNVEFVGTSQINLVRGPISEAFNKG